jgi:hypothetical protein
VSAPEPPQRVALKDPFGSFGKVVGAVAGAGVFVYLIGVVVMWERLAAAHLPISGIDGQRDRRRPPTSRYRTSLSHPQPSDAGDAGHSVFGRPWRHYAH